MKLVDQIIYDLAVGLSRTKVAKSEVLKSDSSSPSKIGTSILMELPFEDVRFILFHCGATSNERRRGRTYLLKFYLSDKMPQFWNAVPRLKARNWATSLLFGALFIHLAQHCRTIILLKFSGNGIRDQ